MYADRHLPGEAMRKGRLPVALAEGSLTLEGDMRQLGWALSQRREHVASRMATLALETGRRLSAVAEEQVADTAEAATACVARWLAGGGQTSPADPARECAHAFAQLAEKRLAPLSELTERCLLWRDAAAELVHEISAELSLSAHARARALVLLRSGLNGALLRVCESFESAHAIAEQELSFAATHDRITGLPSRGPLLARIDEMLHETAGPVCVLLLDLDDFQAVNDRLGYAGGDELLCQVAQRLLGFVTADAMVGHLGGDEFAIALTQPGRAATEQDVERLLAVSRRPYMLAGDTGPLPLTASIGLAANSGCSAEELLRHAATAMHHAKLQGRNRAVRFEHGMQERSHTIDIEMQLRDALAHKQLQLVYQPVFSLEHPLAPTGLEALLRWEHPDRGTVSPADFIPALEQTGLIVDVGRWVLIEACKQCAAWHQEGLSVNVGVNVSARQLDGLQLVDDVLVALSSSGLSPSALVIEVTETAAMRDIELSIRVLRTLKQEGVRVAIDDFGTGYSSLAHLQQLPIDTLKIDRSFVSKASQGGSSEVLLRSLAHLGDSLQMITLAEGVETLGELNLLQAMGYQRAQGFFLSRPLAAATVAPFLREKMRSGVA